MSTCVIDGNGGSPARGLFLVKDDRDQVRVVGCAFGDLDADVLRRRAGAAANSGLAAYQAQGRTLRVLLLPMPDATDRDIRDLEADLIDFYGREDLSTGQLWNTASFPGSGASVRLVWPVAAEADN